MVREKSILFKRAIREEKSKDLERAKGCEEPTGKKKRATKVEKPIPFERAVHFGVSQK